MPRKKKASISVLNIGRLQQKNLTNLLRIFGNNANAKIDTKLTRGKNSACHINIFGNLTTELGDNHQEEIKVPNTGIEFICMRR